jgi:hypothetical protein
MIDPEPHDQFELALEVRPIAFAPRVFASWTARLPSPPPAVELSTASPSLCSFPFFAGIRRSSNVGSRMSLQKSRNSLKWCLRRSVNVRKILPKRKVILSLDNRLQRRFDVILQEHNYGR